METVGKNGEVNVVKRGGEREYREKGNEKKTSEQEADTVKQTQNKNKHERRKDQTKTCPFVAENKTRLKRYRKQSHKRHQRVKGR